MRSLGDPEKPGTKSSVTWRRTSE